MMDRHLELMWAGALGSIPLAVLVGVACRLFVRRPATRHALWVMVLGVMFMPAAWWGASVGLDALEPHARRAADTIRELHDDVVAAPVESRGDAAERAASFDTASQTPVIREWTAPVRRETSPPIDVGGTWASIDTIDLDVPALTALSPSAPDVSLSPFRGLDTARAEPEREETVLTDAGSVERDEAGMLDRVADVAAQWTGWTGEVRDAVLGAPRLPRAIWIGGAALVVLVLIWRIVGLVRLVRRGDAVTARDERMVAEVCELLGVKRVPRMVIVDRVVTPMICLGRRATIVVPRALWYGMGEDARRAILTHELAHLRRRDHWVCWGQLAVSCVYWWHPVSWWAGRRIREEADMACDAWVVSTLPRTRRVYAESLVRVRMFLVSTPPLTAAPALGMASSGVARFSRRITMVMTTNRSPRLSLLGSVAALSAASIGALFAPALACPPECEEVPGAESIYFEGDGADEGTTFERFMNSDQDARAGALMEQFREMEARMRTLEAMIRDYAGAPGAAQTLGFGTARVLPDEGARVLAFSPDAPAPVVFGGGVAVLSDDTEIERDYYMPKGRLNDLTELMSRSDVPTLIRPGDNYISVIGTRSEHATFYAFAKLICPEGVKVTEEDGTPVNVRALPVMPTAPAFPGRGQSPNSLRFAPEPASRAEAIDRLRSHREGIARLYRDAEAQRRQAEREVERAESQLERAMEQYEELHNNPARAREYEQRIRQYEERLHALETHAHSLESHAEMMEVQLEDTEDRIEALLEEIEDAAEEATEAALECEDTCEETVASSCEGVTTTVASGR